MAVELVFNHVMQARTRARPLGTGVAAALLLVMTCLGAYQGWQSVWQWLGTHSAFKVEEQEVISHARSAVSENSAGIQPRIVSFGITSALSHYTHWPVRDFYLSDTKEIVGFFSGSGPRLVVLPEASMYTQWKDTPSGERWLWIREHFTLNKLGETKVYTIYSVDGVP